MAFLTTPTTKKKKGREGRREEEGKKWQFFQLRVPQQNTDVDCGPFTCLAAKCAALGFETVFDTDFVRDYFREYMVREVLADRIHPFSAESDSSSAQFKFAE